ncbi:MAG: hypothetical protein COY80_01040, partial [Candidatus Pacebacteria bacterium CG_4_10_14_0_8_um_filter_42_14]
MQKANKGEWSEFYVLLKLIGEGRLFLADKYLKPDKESFYIVLKVFRDERLGKISYDLEKIPGTIVISDSEQKIIGEVNQGQIAEKISSVFSEINNNEERTFTTEQLGSLVDKLRCQQIQAGSQKKVDIHALVKNNKELFKQPLLGFSIKSMLAAPSTLLNASKSTNFTYLVEGLSSADIEEINLIKTRSKIKDRLARVREKKGKISFEKVESQIFDSNLRKIDSSFSKLLASVLLDYYLGFGSKLTSLIENNKKKFSFMEVDYLFKRFLGAIALGMFPNKKWDGLMPVTGGYIIVKE